MKAAVFEIKRFAVHDGDGIRTTVFLKGCPLRCVWCHNPEGLSSKPQLAYYAHKCVNCGECVRLCPNRAHSIKDGQHSFDRSLCTACGKCAENCFSDALTLYGREMTVEELLPILLEDREFYENSGGGVTLSGGECLMQADFCAELLCALKHEGIHTAVDTSGFVAREALDKVMPYTDIFLYDLKAYDGDVHMRCTGCSNRQILDNLKYLDACGKKAEIRIPFVPGFNDDQIEKIAAFLSTLGNITAVRVLPYHNYAGAKYRALDIPNTLPKHLPQPQALEQARNRFRSLKGTPTPAASCSVYDTK